jgi:beta/gamma crystallin/peptidase inhibitor family I36
MIGRGTIACVIGVVCLFSAESASAQPRWGHERTPGAGACFYKDIDFEGQYFCVAPGERLESLPSGMGDKISSIRLLGGTQVTVFRDKNEHGRSAHFTRDVSDLRRDGWNDQISSLEVGRSYGGRDDHPTWGHERPPREGACFYEDKDFQGRSFCARRGATYASLASGFNDRITSIRLFGSNVRLFENENFGGKSTEIKSDVRNLKGHWNDKVSSIRVY